VLEQPIDGTNTKELKSKTFARIPISNRYQPPLTFGQYQAPITANYSRKRFVREQLLSILFHSRESLSETLVIPPSADSCANTVPSVSRVENPTRLSAVLRWVLRRRAPNHFPRVFTPNPGPTAWNGCAREAQSSRGSSICVLLSAMTARKHQVPTGDIVAQASRLSHRRRFEPPGTPGLDSIAIARCGFRLPSSR
jgi:hypothetical protein